MTTDLKPAVRFIIPGDIFTGLCVANKQVSDALLYTARAINAAGIDASDAMLTGLSNINIEISRMEVLLRAILEEGKFHG